MKVRYLVGGAALAGGIAGAFLGRTRGGGAPRTLALQLAPAATAPPPDQGSVQFIGTATTLIRYAGLTILTDPNFLHRGEQIHLGYGLHTERLTDPAMNFAELPPVDLVLVSHTHEDHFDKLVEERLPKDTPIVTNASAARTLARKGFTRTWPLHTWDTVAIRKGLVSLNITAMPGTHGPTLVSALLPDVMGSMLEFRHESGREYRIYVSGDTLLFRDLEDIPRRYPNVDLALLHLGGTRLFGILLTMDAKQGIQAMRIIGADRTIPIHYNDYPIFQSPLEDFMHAAERAGLHHKVSYLRHGEIYSFAPRTTGVPTPVHTA